MAPQDVTTGVSWPDHWCRVDWHAIPPIRLQLTVVLMLQTVTGAFRLFSELASLPVHVVQNGKKRFTAANRAHAEGTDSLV